MTDLSHLSNEQLMAMLQQPAGGTTGLEHIPTEQLLAMAQKPASPTDSMGSMDRLMSGVGQGMTDVIAGGAQLGAHLNNNPVTSALFSSLGLGKPEDTAQGIDAAVKEKARLDAPLLDTGYGKIGSVGGQVAMTAPLGGGGAGAAESVLAKLGQSALRGAAAGGVGGAIQPVAGDNYASEKAKQIATGTIGGAVVGGGLNSLGQIAEALLPANATKMLVNLGNRRGGANATEGEQLAQQTGVNLTPAQLTGDKTASMAENMARQSIFSRGLANEGDKARVQQLSDYMDRTLNGITQSEASPAIAGAQVQAAAKNVISGLERYRNQTAAEDFGKIRAMTKGQAAIDPANTNQLLQSIYQEASGVGTPTADALAAFAKKQLANVDPKIADAAGKMGGAAGNKLSVANMASAPAEGNLDKLMQLRSYLSKVAGGQAKISGENQDKRIASQLLGSIDQDIESAGDQIGGDLGGMLKTANARYREYSQQIDSVKASPLGKILGEDISGAMQSGNFNTIAPETVIQKLQTLKPTELGVVKGLLQQDQPQAWQMLKRSMLEDAIDKAKAFPPSEGINNPVLRPNMLIKNVGDAKRLQAVFDPNELSQIQAGLDVARRLSDRTGYNFSGTAPANEALGLMNKIKDGGLKGAASLGGAVLGTRALARVMTDSNGRLAMMELSRLSNLGSQRARQLTAQIAAIAAQDQGQQEGQ